MTAQMVFWQYVAPIGGAYLIAWLVHRLSGRIAGRFIDLSGYAPEGMRVRRERQRTLRDLLSSAISFIAFLTATIVTLGFFIDTTTLVWTIGLFSAAFGLGARPIISDYLTGITFIFGDVFDVGEKVEIQGIEGHIEKITLSMVTIRSTHGEVFAIPNGEVRVIRNLSRGSFSSTEITVKLASADLDKAVAILKKLADEAAESLPDIAQPMQLINTSGLIGQEVELTLVARVHYGKAADTRLKLLSLVHDRLTEGGIQLAS